MKKDLLSFVPMTKEEMSARGWSELDVLFITGDAYVDHPSFGIVLLSRYLIKHGFRVGIIAQPEFPGMREGLTKERCIENLRRLGTPKLFVGVGTGVVDSMLNNYTANKKRRSDDSYSPSDKGGRRPDYASKIYAELAKKAFPQTPLIGGGVEISMRRLAHYDFWQNKIFPSLITEAPYDLIVYGMAEKFTLKLAEHLKAGKDLKELHSERGLVYLTGVEESKLIDNRLTLPSFEEVKTDKKKFARFTVYTFDQINPLNAKTLVQYHGTQAVVVTPPENALTSEELDEIYDLHFTRKQHWIYEEKIPACEMIKFSVTTNRGCFGGCSFCAITLHQGKEVQSRSPTSILNEVKELTHTEGFTGTISDLGGPSANMYKMGCMNPEAKAVCKKPSCLHPTICPNLKTDHKEQIELLKDAAKIEKVKRILIASGVRYDLAMEDPAYLKELISKHVGGHLKIAPEHMNDEVLKLMRKPSFSKFEEFMELFYKYSKEAGKEQYLVPYFISSFPGSTPQMMEELNNWLRAEGWKLQQVQNFIPLPMTMAAAMFYTEMDPVSKEPLKVAKNEGARHEQRRLLQSHRFDGPHHHKKKK